MLGYFSKVFSEIGSKSYFIQDGPLRFVSSLSVSNKKTIFIGISMKGNKRSGLASVVKNRNPFLEITSRENSSLGHMAGFILFFFLVRFMQCGSAATHEFGWSAFMLCILFICMFRHFTESYDKLEKTRDAIKLLEKK
ncbi:hypothetical protein [Lactococcus lactis]|uniref:hypothetical protein n=1 Tax=Lactococcus lactis TaxID=1358 RepID=UPI0029059E96|nr:hypothetical protein [Lactococcus lactis]